MAIAHAEIGETATHHDPPDVVAQRQGLGIWLFIAGDAVILVSILFTYLYLRGLNTEKQWMPAGVHAASGALIWGTAAVVIVSALAIWSGERATHKGAGGAIPASLLAAVLALVGAVLGFVSLHNIPQAVNASSGVRQVDGSYASSLLAIDASNILHLLLLAFLGVAVALRTSRGKITAANPTHARLVRIFWVWVAFSTTFSALIATTFVASPH